MIKYIFYCICWLNRSKNVSKKAEKTTFVSGMLKYNRKILVEKLHSYQFASGSVNINWSSTKIQTNVAHRLLNLKWQKRFPFKLIFQCEETLLNFQTTECQPHRRRLRSWWPRWYNRGILCYSICTVTERNKRPTYQSYNRISPTSDRCDLRTMTLGRLARNEHQTICWSKGPSQHLCLLAQLMPIRDER